MHISKNELKRLASLMIDHDIKDKKALANELGVCRQYVSRLMNGVDPYWTLRQRIADHFKVPYKSLWDLRKAA